MKLDEKVIVIGGPIAQRVDPVLSLVPSGSGRLADEIADELEKHFDIVRRIGNFPGGEPVDFELLLERVKDLRADAVVFLAHVPNVLVVSQTDKLRVKEGETGEIRFVGAPKIVKLVKQHCPNTLLVPFKLADSDMTKIGIIRWMLDLHAGLAVYSRIGTFDEFHLIDALGNEEIFSKADLPKALAEKIRIYASVVRRGSIWQGDAELAIPFLEKFVNFSRRLAPAFQQLVEKSVRVDRWPGNFSFRCGLGFYSARLSDGFVITKRDVPKDGLETRDFVFVRQSLEQEKLAFQGDPSAKPSVDAPLHRIIYAALPWVRNIVHGHLYVSGEYTHDRNLPFWPCGAEQGGQSIVDAAPRNKQQLWVANITGHGFVALLGDENPGIGLDRLAAQEFSTFLKE